MVKHCRCQWQAKQQCTPCCMHGVTWHWQGRATPPFMEMADPDMKCTEVYTRTVTTGGKHFNASHQSSLPPHTTFSETY